MVRMAREMSVLEASRRWYSGEVSSASATPKNHREKDWILSSAAIAKRRFEKIGKIFFGDISPKIGAIRLIYLNFYARKQKQKECISAPHDPAVNKTYRHPKNSKNIRNIAFEQRAAGTNDLPSPRH